MFPRLTNITKNTQAVERGKILSKSQFLSGKSVSVHQNPAGFDLRN